MTRIIMRVTEQATPRFTLVRYICEGAGGERLEWEGIVRNGVSDVVGVFAVTPERRVPLVEQFRAPVGTRALELPAGLCDRAAEPPEVTAVRELEEETGWVARHVTALPIGAESAGLSASRMHTFIADDLVRGRSHLDRAEGVMGLHVIEFPVDDLAGALTRYQAETDYLVDPKIMSGLVWWRTLRGGAP